MRVEGRTDRSAPALHAVALVAVAACLSDLWGGSRIPIYRDLYPFVYPYRAFLAEHLARGEVPLWNPFLQLGVPFAASLHASVFYPPSLLLLLVPLPIGFSLFLLAHFGVAWVGAWSWLRDAGASREGALAGAIVFTIGGYLVSSVTNTAHLQAAVWAPWILLAWTRACRGSRAGRVATPLLLAVQVLAGAPEVWAATAAIGFAWTLFAAPSPLARRVRLALGFGACAAVALALVAFQLVLTVEYIAASRRGGLLSPAEITYWSMSPASLLQLVLPPSTVLVGEGEGGTIGAVIAPRLPWVHSVYLGIGALGLAAAGIVAGRERAFWALAAIAGVLLALGTSTPLYRLLLALVPDVFARLRYPEKFLFVFHLAAAALVAHGATAALAGSRGALRLVVIVSATLGAGALGVAALAWLAPARLADLAGVLSGRGDWPVDAFVGVGVDLAYKSERAALLLLAWGALAALRSRNVLGPTVFAVLVIALLGADLAAAHRRLWVSMPAAAVEDVTPLVDVEALRPNRQRIYHYTTRVGTETVPGLFERQLSIDERTDLRRFAIETKRTLHSAIGMSDGVGNVTASDSIGALPELEHVLARLPRERAVDLLGAFSVAMLVGEEELGLPNVERAGSTADEGPLAYRIREVLPFAYLATTLEVADDTGAALRRLADASFPRGERALVETLPEAWDQGSAEAAGAETARLRAATSDTLEIGTDAPGTRLLVVNQSFFPGWRVTVDGRPGELVRANGLVQGVVLPPGRHEVRLEYRPRGLGAGFAVSLATLAALGIGGAILPRRRGPTAG